jgi:hypothetical protein
MSDPKAPKPIDAPPLDLQDDTPPDVGMAEMDKDGTLRLHLRTELADGTVGEALLIVPPKDDRYPAMKAHLAGMKPGEKRSIPPFPGPVIDPDSV